MRSDVRVEDQLAQDAWPVRVDPNQLEAAILNLAINARDAMPNGGTLRLETANVRLAREPGGVELNGDFVVLTVADTGTGIPPGVLEKVFEPFFTTKEIGAGSGLGLSMVQGFAQQSSGAVRITSEVGRGTTVMLYLPRSNEAASADLSEAVATAPCGGTILLVDDDPEVRSVTFQLLEMSGYTVVVAACAEDAIDSFERARQAIDLVITDLVLEGGPDGLALATELRAKRPDLPVLLVTGHGDALLAGPRMEGIELLKKPFGHPVLLQAIARAMAAGRSAEGVAPGVGSA
jgi:CheY-like chemotaxis protein